MRIIPPFMIPAEPTPAMARPMMNVTEFGAAPQMTEPTSNIKMTAKKVYFGEQNVYTRPRMSWKAHAVRLKALPYHPISLRLWNSFVICGMAVAMIVIS